MANLVPHDKSNGYDEAAERFMRARNSRIGVEAVLKWSKELARGASILDLGCGHGVPIAEALINAGFQVYGVDASAKLVAAFRRRFPDVTVQCAAAEDSEFFNRGFDGVVAWGLVFLLPVEVQAVVIGKAARALNANGKLLFTSPREAVTWSDALTGRTSVSPGIEAYERILSAEGLALAGEAIDEGDNHYYFATRS